MGPNEEREQRLHDAKMARLAQEQADKEALIEQRDKAYREVDRLYLQIRDLREALESVVRVSKTPSTVELAQLALDGKWSQKRNDEPRVGENRHAATGLCFCGLFHDMG